MSFLPQDPQVLPRLVKNTFGTKSFKGRDKYLGLPLVNGRVTKVSFNKIIESMENKLSVWYAKNLNYVGRAVLIHYTLSSIPMYAMSTSFFPKILLNLQTNVFVIIFGILKSIPPRN